MTSDRSTEFHTGWTRGPPSTCSRTSISPRAPGCSTSACGIGGTARHLVHEHDVDVRGIDLTDEFVETGRILNRRVAMDDRIDLDVADASAIPSDDGAFDAATLLHVGMNISDKSRLFAEIARVLKPGGRLALYDVMRVGDGVPVYPLPWSSDERTNFLDTPETYERLLREHGLSLVTTEDRTGFARAFFAKVRAAASAPGGPPPVGLHLLMGPGIGTKIGNFASLVEAGALAPIEMIAEKRR